MQIPSSVFFLRVNVPIHPLTPSFFELSLRRESVGLTVPGLGLGTGGLVAILKKIQIFIISIKFSNFRPLPMPHRPMTTLAKFQNGGKDEVYHNKLVNLKFPLKTRQKTSPSYRDASFGLEAYHEGWLERIATQWNGVGWFIQCVDKCKLTGLRSLHSFFYQLPSIWTVNKFVFKAGYPFLFLKCPIVVFRVSLMLGLHKM